MSEQDRPGAGLPGDEPQVPSWWAGGPASGSQPAPVGQTGSSSATADDAVPSPWQTPGDTLGGGFPDGDRSGGPRHGARVPAGLLVTGAVLVALVAALLGGGLEVSAALAATTDATAGPTATPTATATPSATPAPRAWYVDCSRKTNGTGTTAHPWNSVRAVTTHGRYAPGERILLKRGTTCHGRIVPKGSGTAAAPIVLGSYGKGTRPVVAGGGTANGTGAVQLTNLSYWTVQDLHITNRGSSKSTRIYRSGLLLLNHHGGRMRGITAQRLLIDSVWSNPSSKHNDARAWGGITALTPGGERDGFDGLRILHNTLSHVGRSGIVMNNHEYPGSADTNARIAYNNLRWVRGDSIIAVGARHTRIDHNVSAHGAAFWPCPQCGRITPDTANAGVWTAKSYGVVIEHNEVSGEHWLGGDGEAFDLDRSASHAVVQYNYAHDNQGGGMLICAANHSHIRFNILQNNGRAAVVFTCHQSARTIWIYNNTIYIKRGVGSDYVVKQHWNKASGIRFFNNLVYSTDRAKYAWPSRPRSAANTFVGTHSASEPKGTGTSHRSTNLRSPGHGKAGMRSLGGYRVRSTKHAQRGIAIPSSVKVDFFGKKVSTKHPIRGAASS